MVDIDEFKKYNDSFGHQEGDHAIALQAQILQQVFKRAGDIVGRYGGEEYIVAMSGVCEKELSERCAEVNQIWKEKALLHSENANAPTLNCSIGGLVAKSMKVEDLSKWINQADQNLYEAKANGRATFVVTEARCS